ncbi:MAG: histidine phosphatase family protein [Bacteroidetes bacterium]|nr:histidine phosphatase family protein [Bacteroidota bacterium]
MIHFLTIFAQFAVRKMMASIFMLALTSGMAMAQIPENAITRAVTAIDANILFIRHALAPGFGDPDHFRLDDCMTQRNLDASGRQQARDIGAYMRLHALTFDAILSSQWCRCRDTAAEIALSPFDIFPGLNSFFQNHADRSETLALLDAKMAEIKSDQLVLMVTHQVVITAVTGITPRSGGMIAFNSRTGEALRVNLPPE